MTQPVMPAEATVGSVLAELVAFRSVSATSNLDLIAYIESRFAAHNIATQRIASDDGSHSNLVATVGPMREGGVVLSGHTDVVPAAGQAWTSDPFTLREQDGRLYGRGTCDMKGFLAVCLALLPEVAAFSLKRPLHFAFSYDEELGCLGAPRMIDHIVRTLPKPAAVIVGEPTQNHVVSAHKGCLDFSTHIKGRSIHSSLNPRGVNAISVAAQLIGWLDARQAEAAARTQGSVLFDPAYTTLHCGLISGGTASNIVPAACQFTTDIRVAPGESANSYLEAYRLFIDKDILPRIRAVAPEADVHIDVAADIPAFECVLDSEAERLVRRLTGDNVVRAKASVTEAGQFQKAGFATVICGPGSIEQAHMPDEFVQRRELEQSVGIIRRVAFELSA